MVKIITVIFIITGAILPVMAQHNCNDTVKVFGSPEELPVFNKKSPGIETLLKFVAENMEYPETAKGDRIEGRVAVEFWIDTCGITHNHRIVKSVRKDIDDEALRVAKLVKFDVPATNRGQPVGMCFLLPVSFKLPDENAKSSRKLKCRPWSYLFSEIPMAELLFLVI